MTVARDHGRADRDVAGSRPMSPALPPRYSRRLDDELLNTEESPRYSRLFADDFIPPSLIPPAIPEESRDVSSTPQRGPSSPRSVPNLRSPNLISSRLAARPPPPTLPPGPVSLTIDSGAIYPPPPSAALYHLPRALSWNGNEIFLNLSVPNRSTPNSNERRHLKDRPRDLNLYLLRRTPLINEVTLIPKRGFGKSAVMRGKRSKFGGGTAWEAEVGGKVVLRYAKGRWKDHSGKTIAAERRGDARQTPAGDQSFLPEITIFNGSIAGLSEATTRHLLVAAWIARLWQSRHKYIPLLRALVRGRAFINRGFDPT